ncbi:phage integrase SAM-like domain-containing protein [Ectopseudomonas khazarica]|uniref:phage integrase SAM-like domain-containing protein n=1 Tax=Ectopseudomonas khazarica TaxID=2502979 RepID=UPI003B94DD43
MALSKDLLTTLHTFHLGNPESQWPELKAKLLEIAEDSLGTATGIDELDVALLNHSEALEYLHLIGQVGGLTVDQAKARRVAIRIVQGVMTKLEKGDTQQLEEVIKELRADEPVKVVTTTKPEEAPQEGSPVYFAELGENYLKEQGLNVRESTLNNLKSTVKTISDYMGTTDMRTHTRGDLLDLRDYLLLERKVSTVNRILTTLSGVLEYAVNSGMIEKAWDKKLKILKGADSSRESARYRAGFARWSARGHLPPA